MKCDNIKIITKAVSGVGIGKVVSLVVTKALPSTISVPSKVLICVGKVIISKSLAMEANGYIDKTFDKFKKTRDDKKEPIVEEES